jgi:hypothetical protein
MGTTVLGPRSGKRAHRKAHRQVVAVSFEDIYKFLRSGGSEAEAEAEAEMDTLGEVAQDEQLQQPRRKFTRLCTI